MPLMLPNLVYKINVEVENIDATGANDIIKVFVIDSKSTLPLITANLSQHSAGPRWKLEVPLSLLKSTHKKKMV